MYWTCDEWGLVFSYMYVPVHILANRNQKYGEKLINDNVCLDACFTSINCAVHDKSPMEVFNGLAGLIKVG